MMSRIIIILGLTVLLASCVTTNDSSLSRNADPEVALERYVNLGFEYIKREDFTRAKKHLNRALEIDDDNAPANSALGLIYSRQGDKEIAEKMFKKAIAADPTYTRGRTYYAAYLFTEGRFETALEQFLIAAEDTTFPSRSQLYTNIALCQIRLDKPDAAILAYERALQLDRFNSNALAGMTEVLLTKNDFKRAQFYYNRLVNQIAQQALTHSAQTLWQGVRIAKHFNAVKQAESLAALLRELYPDSQEYKNYLSLYFGK